MFILVVQCVTVKEKKGELQRANTKAGLPKLTLQLCTDHQ